MKVYTQAEFDCQRLESTRLNQINYNCRGFSEVARNIHKWSDYSSKFIKFASGIELTLCDEIVHYDHNVANEHNDFKMLVSKFYLSGYHSVVSPEIKNVAAGYTEKAGQNYLFYLPNIQEIEQFFRGTPLKKIVINLELNFLRSFVSQLDDVPQQLRYLIERDNAPNFHRRVGKVTPTMQTIIRQMWDHPYQGAIATMYLEGKTLELLAMQYAQLTESDLHTAELALNKNIDLIYEARNILKVRLENPPSILELAEQVGVSDRTLQRGFRKLFGTTVVGYLNQLRIEQAETLLRTGKLSVAEVANKVGYSHLGHFTTAFKRQLAITPSECLVGKLRD